MYHFFREKTNKLYWHEVIRKHCIPPKHSITVWLAMRGHLKIVDRLKHLCISQVCSICNTHMETHDHLFFVCKATEAVWTRVKIMASDYETHDHNS